MKRLNGFLTVVNGTPISLSDFEKTILRPTFNVSTTAEILKDIKYAAYISCIQKSYANNERQEEATTTYRKNDSYIEFASFVLNDLCVIRVVGYGKKTKRIKV